MKTVRIKSCSSRCRKKSGKAIFCLFHACGEVECEQMS
jgi:hypothetical protein